MKGVVIVLVLGISGLFSSFHDTVPLPKVTGSVEGVVVLTPKQATVRFGGGNRYGRPTRNQDLSASSPEDSVLIWLESSSEPNLSPSGAPVILDQKDLKFNPTLLPVRQHETVRIHNSDPVYHNVFSLSSIKRFDVGRRPKGEYLDVTFDKQGLINVFCDIHSNMHAVIYVMGPNVLTWSKVKGGEPFRMEKIPWGNYRLHIYALGYEEKVVSLEVESGETIQIGTITLTS